MGSLGGSRRERRVRRLADENCHLHRVLVAPLVAPLDALPRFGSRGGVIRAPTEGKAQLVLRRWGEVSVSGVAGREPEVSEGQLLQCASCAVSFLLEIFTHRFQFGVCEPPTVPFFAFLWQSEGLFRTEGRLGPNAPIRVGRARGELGSRTANVRPAREKRERWSPNDRPNGRRRRRYGIPARSNPAPPRAPSRSRGALPEVTFRPCVFLPSPPSLGR